MPYSLIDCLTVVMRAFFKFLIIFLICMLPMLDSYAVPAGFEDISTEETSDVAVYCNNSFIGRFTATYDENFLSFENPKALLSKMTMIKPVPSVKKRISNKLAPNTKFICRHKKNCKHLQPKILDIVFDHKNYSVKFVVNPKYLMPAALPKMKYLSASTAPLSHTHRANTYIFGNHDSVTASASIKQTISKGNTSLLIRSSLTSGNKSETLYKISGLDLEHYNQRSVFKAGLLMSGSYIYTPAMNFLGIQLASSQILMTNHKFILGTPILIQTDSPSFIEVSRDGETLSVQHFETGNFYLKTRRFPEGSYFITIKKTDANGNVTKRKIFYVKKGSFPLFDHPNYNIQFGWAKSSQQPSKAIFPKFSSQWLLQTEYEKRLTPQSYVHFGGFFSPNYNLLEVGYAWFKERLLIRPTLAINDLHSIGAAFTFEHEINERLSASFTMRHAFYKYSSEHQDNTYVQKFLTNTISSNLSYRKKKLTAALGYEYNKNPGSLSTYNSSLSCSKQLSSWGKIGRVITASFNRNQNSWKAALSGSFSYQVKKSSHGLVFQTSYEDAQAENTNSAVYTSSFGTKEYSYKIRLKTTSSKNPSQNAEGKLTGASPQNILDYATLNWSKKGNQKGYVTYALLLKPFGIVGSNKSWVWVSPITQSTGALIKIKHGNQDLKMDVIVNDQNKGTASSSRAHFFEAPTFKKTLMALTLADADQMVEVDHSPEPFILYPHNVMFFELKARSYYTLMGTFQNPKGEPIKDAGIEGSVSFGDTDDAGFGQVDVYTGSTITLITEDGKACVVDTKGFQPENGFLWMDNIPCTPKK